MQWPPPGAHEYFQRDRIVSTCRNKTKIDPKIVQAFSDGDDFSRLPTDIVLKDYILCQNYEAGIMTPGSTRLRLDHALDFVQSVDDYYQDIFFKLGRKCLSLKNKDQRELAYQMALCYKRNDPVVCVSITDSYLELNN